MYPMQPGPKAWFSHGYGVSRSEFEENKLGYLKYFPGNKDRIQYLDPNKSYEIKLAYSYFLAETYTLLPFYEKNDIDFVFVLYPGGAFGLDNDSSDAMLKDIFASKNFKKIIVTKNITLDYLLRKKLCDESKMESLHGFVQFDENSTVCKKKYKTDKKTFDVCIVAAKYSDKGIDKGYDLFIEAAKQLVPKYKDMRFHVVGGFDENEIDVSDIRDNITFYGFRQPDFLSELYSGMDIFLSPNRAFQLYPGNFDGLMGADAAYAGVALFITDELGQHVYFKDGQDVIIIKSDLADIVKKVTYYYKHPAKLYKLSERGQAVMKKTFDIRGECEARVRIFREILEGQKATAK
jgi:glycosyltransferase involved in cell wall biosynthesis